MNRKSFIKKLALSEEALENIKKAVQNAEKNTSGEIVVAVAKESSDYSFWEILASLIVSLIVFCVMIPFSGMIRNFYESINWQAPEWYLSATYGFTIFLVVLVFFAFFNIPLFDRLIIPSFVKVKNVSDRAFRAFTETGTYCTKDHTGILIFVSFLERQVRVIADKGISEKISQDMWNLIASGLTDELKNGHNEEAFIDAIEKCGKLLSDFYPIKKDDVDELSDGLVLICD